MACGQFQNHRLPLDARHGRWHRCLALLSTVVYFAWLEFYVNPLRNKAEQRWAEIGRPMPEFEQTLKRVEENESLRQLAADLKPFGVADIYKAPEGMVTPPAINNLINLMTDYGENPTDTPAAAAKVQRATA